MPSPPAPGTVDVAALYCDAQTKEIWLGVASDQDPQQAVLLSDIVGATAALAANSTADRAYTDTRVATRAPTVHSHVVADVTGLQAQLDALGSGVSGGIPSGMIAIWKGTIITIPAGWVICDGANGTPDLRDKFVMGSGGGTTQLTSGGGTTAAFTTGLAGAHDHSGVTSGTAINIAQMPIHTHALSDPGHGHFLSGNSSAAADHQHVEGQGAFSISSVNNVRYGGIDTGVAAESFAYLGLTGLGAYTSPAGNHQHSLAGGLAAANVTGILLGYTGVGDPHNHQIAFTADHQHVGTVSTLPPYFVLAFVMKI